MFKHASGNSSTIRKYPVHTISDGAHKCHCKASLGICKQAVENKHDQAPTKANLPMLAQQWQNVTQKNPRTTTAQTY